MTKDKPLYYYNRGNLRATIWQFWAWYDGWTGYFWDKKTNTLYKNIIPFFPWWILAIRFEQGLKCKPQS